MATEKQPLTYADAGVDIDAGNDLVERIKPAVKSTNRAGVMSGIGGFGGLFDLKAAGYTDPVLVAATDGVGTKLRVAIETGHLSGVGVDLVAMCVNDLICQGAEPLFFLDYFATAILNVPRAEEVIAGIAAGCRDAGCALIGGETAEMPGMYSGDDFDLAGFAVGAMERGAALPRDVCAGDVLIGLASSGVHSNGYSLVRRCVEREALDWDAPAPFAQGTLGAALLAPTRIYVAATKPLIAANRIKAMAHITGGGITENLPRVLPDTCGAHVDLDSWPLPEIFGWLMDVAGIDMAEALKTFNCGIGLVLVVAADAAASTLAALADAGEDATVIGQVVEGTGVRYSGSLR